MSTSLYIEPISKGKELIEKNLIDEFGIVDKYAEVLYLKLIKPHFDKLKDTIYLLVETNYVDKVYRDSYYHYYSSKLTKYKRDCVRISLFDGIITDTDFTDNVKVKELQEKYRGFIVLRPTEPNIIGRSIISPQALKENSFLCCSARFNATSNGVKFYVEAFPHSSQDKETISCAETTLWAIMEYFSNKYAEYRPVLPSGIINTLNKVSSERQMPSKGLNISQMSFALKEYGFGTKIYSKAQYKEEFENLLSCYIESGIPLIVAIENRAKGGNIGHALLAIGHEKIVDAEIDAVTQYIGTDATISAKLIANTITLYDYNSIKKKFIFIDDNRTVYQKATLEKPAEHYDAKWQNCEITFFIVPLYPKIYLEAFEAKNFILRFLTIGPEPLSNNSTVLLRYYLASSRSFKDKLAVNGTVNEELKQIIMETSMPKFVWVAELSTKDLIKQGKANGIIILDATEANILFNKPLILGAYQGKLVMFDEKTKKLDSNVLPLPEFKIYENNLNTYSI